MDMDCVGTGNTLHPNNQQDMDIDGVGTSIVSQPYSKMVLTDLEDHTVDNGNPKSVALHEEKNK